MTLEPFSGQYFLMLRQWRRGNVVLRRYLYCTYEVTTTTVNTQLLAYQNAAADFISNNLGECLAYDLGFGGLTHRSMNGTEEYSLSTVESRQSTLLGGSVPQIVSLLYALLNSIIDASDTLKAYRGVCKCSTNTFCCCKSVRH